MMRKILVTGGNGFVGKALIRELADGARYIPIAAVRIANENNNFQIPVGEIDGRTNWNLALKNVTVVIHTAARVHVMEDHLSDPLTEYRKVNVQGTVNLARQAEQAGVKRFIYISSIKVNGEGTPPNRVYSADDIPSPVDDYGISKMEAENALRLIGKETDMEIVIIRPTLIYGPGVKANFRKIISWVNNGIFLPFGGISNKRSFVALDNLVDLIITCIEHPMAANQIFLVSDDRDISTRELCVLLGNALGKSARLLNVPQAVIKFFLRLIGRHAYYNRLCGSLQVDSKRTQMLLNWNPPVSVEQALQETAHYYLKSK